MFLNNELAMPSPVLNETLGQNLPFVFVGDDAFTFTTNLMKPFDFQLSGKPVEIVFNYRLSRARRVVENAFGILASRFRIFRTNIIGSETLVQNIILATTALHNLHLQREEESVPPRRRAYAPPGYADHFLSNGRLKKGRWRYEDKKQEKAIFKRLYRNDVGSDHVGGAYEVRERFMELFVRRPLAWQNDILPEK